MTDVGVGPSAFPGPKGVRRNVSLLRRMLQNPTPVLDECAAEFGATFAFGVGPVRLVVVGDPAALDDLFAQPNSSYRWGHVANVLGTIVGPTSMIVSDGDDHHRRRSAAQPAFARRRLDGWIPMIVASADQMIDTRLLPALASGGSVDAYPLGKDLVLAITVKAFFGNGLEHRTAEIGAIFDVLQAYIELPGPKHYPNPFPGSRRAKVRAARKAFDRLVDEEVARRRADQLDQPNQADLLDVFVEEGSSPISGQEIHDQVNTLIGAGYNTTAATLAWTIHRALATPGVWDQLRVEADAVFGPHQTPPKAFDADTFQSLTYARAVVHEALRIHPAGVISPRQAVVDVPIGVHTIPKNAMVLWSPYLAGRDAGAWDDPLAFRPERHLNPSPEDAARMEKAWVPFGRGPRRCIGFALAQMELTLIVSRLAQRADMALVNEETPSPYGMVVNRPLGGVIVAARRVSRAGL